MTSATSRRAMITTSLAAAMIAAPGQTRHGWAQHVRPESRTARIVVPFAAGGTTDLVARAVAEILTQATGGPLSRRTGLAATATRAPSGWRGLRRTVVPSCWAIVGSRSPISTSTNTFPTTAWRVSRPWPWSERWRMCWWSIRRSIAVLLPELVEHCRPQRGCSVGYGSPGKGSVGHLAMEYLKSVMDIDLAPIAHRGRSRLTRDLLAGHVPVAMDNLTAYLTHIRSGALRALAVSSSERWFAAPDIPTVSEHGCGDFNATLWWYVAAPAGIRRTLVRDLSNAIVAGLRCEAMIGRMRSLGVLERPRCAEELVDHMLAESAKWKKLIAAARIVAR